MVNHVNPRNVIVGISGSPHHDDDALAWAVAHCVRDGSNLVIAHACLRATSEHDHSTSPVFSHPGLSEATTYARRALGTARVSTVIRQPPSGQLLVDLGSGADLLVIGAPTHHGWVNWNSTTHHVVRHANGPVVVARSTRQPRHDNPFTGNVIVGVDGSAGTRAGLAFAFGYAQTYALPLVAVTVTRQPTPDLWYDDQTLETHLTAEPAALTLLSNELEPWERAYPGVRVKRAVVHDDPIDGLLRAADGAALLVLGSTSPDAVDRANCPLAIVPPGPAANTAFQFPQEAHHVPA